MPIPSFRHLDGAHHTVPNDLERMAGRVLGAVRGVYRELGPGLTEAMYQEALGMAFEDEQIPFIAQPEIPATFRGRTLRRHVRPDFVVANGIVLEIKAVEQFHPVHEAQLTTYLRLTQRPLGFLINFNAPALSEGIRRRILS